LTAVRSTGPIHLDGSLHEPAWQVAPIASRFIQNDPREGQPADCDTEVRVLYDDDAIDFGVFAKDDDPQRLIVGDIKEDFNAGRGSREGAYSVGVLNVHQRADRPVLSISRRCACGAISPRTRTSESLS
jgi:hypothetical protein